MPLEQQHVQITEEASTKTSQELSGIKKALDGGARVRGFVSGSGLRVIRIEQQDGLLVGLVGYGESPDVEEALRLADEDFLPDGRMRGATFYGGTYHPSSTENIETTTPLDAWLRSGKTFEAHLDKESGKVIVELQGLGYQETPQEILTQVGSHGGSIEWMQRGFTFETYQFTLPSGKQSISTRVLSVPKGKTVADGFYYSFTKTGAASSFDEALNEAFTAPGV